MSPGPCSPRIRGEHGLRRGERRGYSISFAAGRSEATSLTFSTDRSDSRKRPWQRLRKATQTTSPRLSVAHGTRPPRSWSPSRTPLASPSACSSTGSRLRRDRLARPGADGALSDSGRVAGKAPLGVRRRRPCSPPAPDPNSGLPDDQEASCRIDIGESDRELREQREDRVFVLALQSQDDQAGIVLGRVRLDAREAGIESDECALLGSAYRCDRRIQGTAKSLLVNAHCVDSRAGAVRRLP